MPMPMLEVGGFLFETVRSGRELACRCTRLCDGLTMEVKFDAGPNKDPDALFPVCQEDLKHLAVVLLIHAAPGDEDPEPEADDSREPWA